MRHLLLSCSIIIALAAWGAEPDRAALLREKIKSCDPTEILVVAHRGDWRFAPENSIAAIEHSIAVGVDIVELDLQLSKDSVLFVIHDSTLDRTTTGKGKINSWTSDSLRTLKLKNGAGIRTLHRLPTLEEAMLATKGKVLVNLDKADRYFDLVIPVLEKTGTTSQVIMKGPKPAAEVDSLYGAYLDKVIYMPKIRFDNPDASEMLDEHIDYLKPLAFELSYSVPDFEPAAIAAKDKLKGKSAIWYNTLWDTQCGGHDDERALIDPDAAYGFLIDKLGATIIQTDRAEYLLNYLRSRSLHN